MAITTPHRLLTLAADRHEKTASPARWLVPNSQLPGVALAVSEIFADAAVQLLSLVPDDGPELSAALRKLLEAKDAAVRARLDSDRD